MNIMSICTSLFYAFPDGVAEDKKQEILGRYREMDAKRERSGVSREWIQEQHQRKIEDLMKEIGDEAPRIFSVGSVLVEVEIEDVAEGVKRVLKLWELNVDGERIVGATPLQEFPLGPDEDEEEVIQAALDFFEKSRGQREGNA